MKNKSWKYPFSRLGDSRFDKDKNGELDYEETFWRDWRIKEEKELDKKFTEKSENHVPDSSGDVNTDGYGLTMIFLTIAVVVLAFVIAFNTENDFIRGLILLASVGIGWILLKSGGLTK